MLSELPRTEMINFYFDCSFANAYKRYVPSETGRARVEAVDQDIQAHFLHLAETLLVRLNSQYLAAATFGKERITAWFNGQMMHTAPLSLNLIHNAVVRASLGDDHSITVINEPLKFSPNSTMAMAEIGNSFGYNLSSNLGFGMAFVCAFYVMFLIKVNSNDANRKLILKF